jgi:cytoskeletal protein CcmA (bactofilin family)
MAKEELASIGSLYNSLTDESRIVGRIVANNDFRIDGEIEGENGYLKGSISCVSAEIIGRVEGNITATETLSLRSTANITSRVIAKRLLIEPKAVFDGTCSFKSSETVSVKD